MIRGPTPGSRGSASSPLSLRDKRRTEGRSVKLAAAQEKALYDRLG